MLGGINLNSFSNLTKILSPLLQNVAGPNIAQGLQAFSGIVDSFGGAAGGLNAFSGAGATALPSPQSRLGHLAGMPSGAGPGIQNMPALWQAASGGGAGTGIPSGGGVNLADQAKAQNWQYLDDRQKANMALQEASQKQSEAAALITTLMKMLHDTLMQIIQNMK